MFNQNVEKFLIWIGITLLGFIIAKLSFIKINCPNLTKKSWITKLINFKENSDGSLYFQITQARLSNFHRVYDYLETTRSSLLIFFLANVNSRIHLDDISQLYLLLALFWIPIFGFIGELKGMGFSISPGSIKNLSLQAKIVLVLLIMTMLALMGFNGYLAYYEKILPYYLTGIIAIPTIYFALYKYYLSSSDGKWHIHHWFIGFYFCLCTRFDHWICNTFFMIFYSVFLQGSLAYGLTPIITAVTPSDMLYSDYVWTGDLYYDS